MFMRSYQGEIPNVSVIVGAEKDTPNLYSYFGKPKMNMDKKIETKEEDANEIMNVVDDNDDENNSDDKKKEEEDMIETSNEHSISEVVEL